MADVKAWKAEYRALAQRSATCDLERRGFYATKSGELALDAKQVQDEEAGLDGLRTASKNSLRVKLVARKAELGRIREQIDALRRGDTTRAAAVAANRRKRRPSSAGNDDDDDELCLRGFDSELASFRERMRHEYDELRSEERALFREVDACATRFDAWRDEDDAALIVRKRLPSAKQQQAADDLMTLRPPSYEDSSREDAELREIDAELRSTDAYGGWHEDEHAAFVRLWAAVKRRPEDVAAKAAAERMLASRSAEAIHAHAEWWARHQALTTKKRLLIGAWREAKQKTEDEQAALALSEAAKAESERLAADKAETDRLKLKRQSARETARSWRAEKSAKEQAVRDVNQAHLDAEKRKAAQSLAVATKERRAKVHDYKARKAVERQMADQEVVLEENLRLAQRHQPSKQDLALNAKRALDKAKDRRQEALDLADGQRRDARLRAVAAAAKKGANNSPRRDVSRLLRPTSSSKCREYSVGDVDDAEDVRSVERAHARPIASGGYDLRHGARATPAWRRNIV